MQAMYAVALTWRMRKIEHGSCAAVQGEEEAPGGWVAYADDTHLIGTPSALLRRLKAIEEHLPAGGQQLQPQKCAVWCTQQLCEEEAAALRQLEERTQRAEGGLVLLGAEAGTEDLAFPRLTWRH